MDVASIIATVNDPSLRREMLGNLTQEQIDTLPAALRTEAMNYRRPPRDPHPPPGFDFGMRPPPGGMFGGDPRHPRPGGFRDPAEELEFIMNRMGRYREGDAHAGKMKKDPSAMPLDQLVCDFTAELDQKVLDDNLQHSLAIITE
jgi:hypothetical protein